MSTGYQRAAGQHHHFPADTRQHAVADLIDQYLETVLPHKSSLSIERQTQQLGWWKDQLGRIRLVDLTPDMIAICRDRLHNILRAVRSIVSWQHFRMPYL